MWIRGIYKGFHDIKLEGSVFISIIDVTVVLCELHITGNSSGVIHHSALKSRNKSDKCVWQITNLFCILFSHFQILVYIVVWNYFSY